MQSVVTFEKPLHHLSLSDWDARLAELQTTADTRIADAFQLRHNARQVRNETRIRTMWGAYHNNNRLSDRIYETEQWSTTLRELLRRVDRETNALKDEKASTDRELEQLEMPLHVTAECLSNRDGRRSSELTYDLADQELKKELCVTESNKKLLIDRCQTAWEKINRLEVVQFKLQLALNDKNEALAIDRDMLTLDSDCANITYKLDPRRVPKHSLTYEEWLQRSEETVAMAQEELRDTLRQRDQLSVARARARDSLRAQADSTDYTMRRRVHDTKRALEELTWQKQKMEDNMDKLTNEIATLQGALVAWINAQKLAETRLETRSYRPGIELCMDEADLGLKEESEQIRKTIAEIQEKFDCAKATYNALEAHSVRIALDLADKEHTLQTDQEALEMRAALVPASKKGTELNIELTKMEHSIPST